MRRPKLNGTLIGNMYPFFLNNSDLKNSAFYLYQLVSPGVDLGSCRNEVIPLLTFMKVGERTGPKDFSANEKGLNHADIISTLRRSKKNVDEESRNFLLEEILSRRDEVSSIQIRPNGYDFPIFNLDTRNYNNNTTKSIIVGLRDSLRWKQYRFTPGSYIDLLVTPTKFGVFEIAGTKEDIHLNLISVHKTSDITLSNPLKVNSEDVNYPKDIFSGKMKASDLNRALRNAEWKSFDCPELKIS